MADNLSFINRLLMASTRGMESMHCTPEGIRGMVNLAQEASYSKDFSHEIFENVHCSCILRFTCIHKALYFPYSSHTRTHTSHILCVPDRLRQYLWLADNAISVVQGGNE